MKRRILLTAVSRLGGPDVLHAAESPRVSLGLTQALIAL